MALAAEIDADGQRLCAALLAAYKVASRFGRATQLRDGAHPHGSWGVTGAAAGAARLLGLGAERTAAAVDTASGLPVGGSFVTALDGNPVRNAWMGASNVSGLTAVRMATAGVARNTGTAATSLGGLLGSFDPAPLTEELDGRFDVTTNYYKRHASCSYTHPPVDAVLALLRCYPGLRGEDVRSVLVETHRLGAGLTRTVWPTRLAAMFSIPFVVAAALLRPADQGGPGPEAFGERARADPRLLDLARRVEVIVAPDLDRRLPDERAARVSLVLDGPTATPLTLEVPNPVGDSAHQPFGWPEVTAKLTSLLGADDEDYADAALTAARALPDQSRSAPLLQSLL